MIAAAGEHTPKSTSELGMAPAAGSKSCKIQIYMYVAQTYVYAMLIAASDEHQLPQTPKTTV